jgi:hypothetical protein
VVIFYYLSFSCNHKLLIHIVHCFSNNNNDDDNNNNNIEVFKDLSKKDISFYVRLNIQNLSPLIVAEFMIFISLEFSNYKPNHTINHTVCAHTVHILII